MALAPGPYVPVAGRRLLRFNRSTAEREIFPELGLPELLFDGEVEDPRVRRAAPAGLDGDPRHRRRGEDGPHRRVLRQGPGALRRGGAPTAEALSSCWADASSGSRDRCGPYQRARREPTCCASGSQVRSYPPSSTMRTCARTRDGRARRRLRRRARSRPPRSGSALVDLLHHLGHQRKQTRGCSSAAAWHALRSPTGARRRRRTAFSDTPPLSDSPRATSRPCWTPIPAAGGRHGRAHRIGRGRLDPPRVRGLTHPGHPGGVRGVRSQAELGIRSRLVDGW